MATQIPKLITNVEPYFRYEGEANATSQDQFQGFLKNEHSVLAVLTKGIWQPTTAYEIGDIINSPNMPKGFHAIAQTKGNSGANEPTWGNGTTNVSDGTVSWKMSKGDITVNGVGADSKGNIQINNIANATHANNADLATKALQDESGQDIDNTYIKNLTYSNGTLSVFKGNNTKSTLTINPDTQTINVTTSKQGDRVAIVKDINGTLDESTNTGSGNITTTTYTLTTDNGIKAGDYSLKTLLQELVNLSHNHRTTKGVASKNCNCNCNCNYDCHCSDGDCT